MKFAEITQEVQIARPTPMKPSTEFGLTPGRRKANQIFKTVLNNLEENGHTEAREIDIDLGLVYKLPAFPEFQLNQDNIDEVMMQLKDCLEDRIRCRRRLLSDFDARRKKKFQKFSKSNFNEFLSLPELHVRQLIYDMESDNVKLKTENAAVTATLNQEREKIKAFETKIIRYESSIDSLNRKLRDREEMCNRLERELNDKLVLLNRKEHEKEKQRKKYNTKLNHETDKMKREFDMKIKEEQLAKQEMMRDKEEKLKKITEIVTGPSQGVSSLVDRFNNQENLRNVSTRPAEHVSRPRVSIPIDY